GGGYGCRGFGSTGFGNTGFGGGTGTLGTNSAQNRPVGASSVGIRRAPAYTTTLGFDSAPRPANAVLPSVQDAITRAARLPSRANIQVALDGRTGVLRGPGAND